MDNIDKIAEEILDQTISPAEGCKKLFLFKQTMDKHAFNTALKKCKKFGDVVDKLGRAMLYEPGKNEKYYEKYPRMRPTEEDKKFYHWREEWKKKNR